MTDTKQEQQLVISKLDSELSAEEIRISQITITTDDVYTYACDILKELKHRNRKIEDSRKLLVKPLNDHVSWINGLFKPLTFKLNKLKNNLEQKMMPYIAEKRRQQEELERKRREAEQAELRKKQREMEELAEKRNNEQALNKAVALESMAKKVEAAPIEPIKQTVRSATTTTSVSTVWEFQIISSDSVPREFCSPDPRKIKDAIKAGKREISGVRIYKEDRIVSR